MGKINLLSNDLINHIAAGEVVERPASVVKELLENAIDAGARKITVRLLSGGIDLIEVIDDGTGMDEDDLARSVLAHATSKISSVDDLSNIQTLGFRGEALSSIAAVSEVTVVSKTKRGAVAHALAISAGKIGSTTKQSRDTGTTVRVERLFSEVPARQKFLKTPQTEYRKIVEVFVPVVLIHPEIHFVLESDRKQMYTLPAVHEAASGTIHPHRVAELFPSITFCELFYDGDGIVVGGFVGHPKHQNQHTGSRYTCVNGRPVWDSGIAKAVDAGTARYIPGGRHVPFLVSIKLRSDQVDVNVHPRKREVRFSNPYRVFAAVEAAVHKAYEETLSNRNGLGETQQPEDRLRHGGVVTDVDWHERSSERDGDYAHERFKGSRRDALQGYSDRYDVRQSIEFSKAVLQDASRDDREDSSGPDALMDIADVESIVARQYLNRYIVAQVLGDMLIIDQHAAAERIRFEKLLSDYQSRGIESQALMLPVTVPLAETEALLVEDVRNVFSKLGYELEVKKKSVELSAVPALLVQGDQEALFRAILNELQEYDQIEYEGDSLAVKYRDSVIATMACHSSVRMNQRLSDKEAASLITDLFTCKNAYSCPHGRPIVWKLTQEELDGKFKR